MMHRKEIKGVNPHEEKHFFSFFPFYYIYEMMRVSRTYCAHHFTIHGT